MIDYGEHPDYSAEVIARAVELIYATKSGNGEIRRVNVNCAPLDVEGYRMMKAVGIGTYQIFQETYHRATYAAMHPRGNKADFLWRLYGQDRAMEGGCDDVGLGALFGLYDWRFEALGLLAHAIHLENSYGVGPHTFSFPRIKDASNRRRRGRGASRARRVRPPRRAWTKSRRRAGGWSPTSSPDCPRVTPRVRSSSVSRRSSTAGAISTL